MPGKCQFQKSWKERTEFKDWLEEGPTKYEARCRICKTIFTLGSMGIAAVRSHMGMNRKNSSSKPTRHEMNMKSLQQTPPLAFFQASTSSSTSTSQSANISDNSGAGASTSFHQTTLNNYANSDATKAEVLWVLKAVTSHYSFKSSEGVPTLFKDMFPDSAIAEKFTMSERKCSYVASFGLYPYLKTQFRSKLGSEPYVLLFDESLNKHVHGKQLDIHVRFWDHDRVVSRYYGSSFLGHATAKDMLKSFNEDFDLKYTNVVQLSMDGPNVNWAFYDLLQKDISTETNQKSSMLNLGSCGLHVVHNAFKSGATASKWNVSSVLSSLYCLFDEAPSRRQDYRTASESDVFPLQFCNHRWLENVPVAERAIQIWPNICKYIKETSKRPKSKQPTCKSFGIVKEATEDRMFVVHLHSFISIAQVLQPFLSCYQTDRVMVPFLADDLASILKSLMKRFIKPKVISKCSVYELTKIDVKKAENLKPKSQIDVGFTADKKVKELYATKKISDRQLIQFQIEVRDFLTSVVTKLLEKSPIKYSVVRNLSCLDPRLMTKDGEESKKRFKRVLSSLNQSGHVADSECDRITSQYDDFIESVVPDPQFNPRLSMFDTSVDNLDNLLYTMLSDKPQFSKLWPVLKKLLILSHGQASVERGFSFNRQIEVENMAEQSYVALRFICDSVQSVGGIRELPITQEMIISVKSAYSKYKAYLDQRSKNKEEDERSAKRKREEEVLDDLRKKKQLVVNSISSLHSSSDDLATQATKCVKNQQMRDLINKSVSFRNTAKEKERELKKLENEIKGQEAEVKSI